MDVYSGLLRQKGHGGLGTLLKLGGSVAASALAPLLGDFVGGLIRKKKNKQTGRGFVTDALKQGFNVSKNAFMRGVGVRDALTQGLNTSKNTILHNLRVRSSNRLKNIAVPLADSLLRQKLPLMGSPIIGSVLSSKVIPMIKNKLASAIERKVNLLMPNQWGSGTRKRRRRRKQRGEGVVSDLVKGGMKQLPKLFKKGTQALMKRGIKKGIKRGIQRGAKKIIKEGTKQAIQTAAKTGIDVLKGKNIKEASVARAIEGIQKAEQNLGKTLPILAKGGPTKKRKRTIKVGTGKKARLMDIFD